MTELDLSTHRLETMCEEHVTTLNHLDLLMQAIRAPRTARDVALPRYRALLFELLNNLEVLVVDHFHFEERCLFPLLRETGSSDLADSLTLEHVAIRTATMPVLACLHAAIAENPSEEQWTEFEQLAMKLIGMKRAHMHREEAELVPVLRTISAESRAVPASKPCA